MLTQINNDIITGDGTTLLGADNKAGVAEIMDAARHLMLHPELKHGTIKILFTPDEEVGRGVDKVDLKKLGADVAYTIDGESRGHIEDETFSADAVTIVIHGISTHPGFAKNKLKSALKIAAALIEALPKDSLSPETTELREGFVHPVAISGSIERAEIQFIIRPAPLSRRCSSRPRTCRRLAHTRLECIHKHARFTRSPTPAPRRHECGAQHSS